MKLNLLSQDEIKYLKPDQLVELLDLLVSAEVVKHFTPSLVNTISVPRPITIKDGGEDANVSLEIDDSFINTSLWIKSKFTCFQSKAQKMDDKACKKEVIADPKKRKNKQLKPRVKSCFDQDGEYILFTIDSLTEQSIILRIDAIREALKECNITDFDNKKIKIYDANQIARWANDHISAITYVQKCRGIARPQPFVTWLEWHKMYSIDKKYEYQESDYLKNYTEELFKLLETEKVIRVVGHKGLGKTRFILESFNPNNKVAKIINLSNSLVYIDLATASAIELNAFIISYRDLEGILIVDNCNDDWHNGFATPIRAGGNLKLITINDSQYSSSTTNIYLERKEQKSAVRLIFQNCFEGLTDGQIDHLVSISEGFPEMVSYIENVLRDKSAELIYSTIPGEFISKFLFAGDKQAAEYELFKACSVFTEFLFFDENEDDILSDVEKKKIINQNTLIHSKITNTPVDGKAFYKFCLKFRDKRSLLEKNGLKYSVIPEPIAVNLAAEWWEEIRFSYIEEIMQELNDNSLLIPMIDRLRSLDQSEKAKGIVSKAWGPNGPFATAEVLNTELGSRLFRSVVEVNPIATADALEVAYENFTLEELKTNLLAGRRNIVWALEKLVFRDETFDISAKVLAKLSAAENENFGNNATAQFLQLFHIHLSGTSANFDKRINLIKWLLEQPQNEYKELAVNAMGRGLKSHGFFRTIGAEHQGFGTTIKEYSPETWDEIFEYWSVLLKLLTEQIVTPTVVRESAKDNIARSIRSLFASGQASLVKLALEEIHQSDQHLWEGAIESLKITSRYETLTEYEKTTLDSLIALLTPVNIDEKIKFIISVPPWDYDPANFNNELNKLKVDQLGKELIDNEVQINNFLPLLLTGEQRQAFTFGAFLAKNYVDILSLAFNALDFLATLPKKDQNPTLIAGIITELTPDNQHALIDQALKTPNISSQAFYLSRMINPVKSDIEKLFSLVDTGQDGIQEFLSFQYGRSLDALPIEDVISICERISQYGLQGAWTSFLIITQYCHENDYKWRLCKDFIENVISCNNFLIQSYDIYRRDEYKWAHYIKKLLYDTEDDNFAQIISKQIREALTSEHFYSSDYFMSDLTKVLAEQYFQIFWNAISDVIVDNGIEFLNLKALIGAKNGAFGSNGTIFGNNHDTIINWCKIKGGKAPLRIAYMMPIFSDKTWHPFALKMIDAFGSDDKFLDEIAANMGSYGMVGSSIPYYTTIIGLAGELLSHHEKNVQKWAKKCITHYKKRIRREQLDEEQRAK